jgi:ribosomal protein L11 methyltransferase
MKHPSHWQIAVTTTAEAEDAVVELFRRLGHEMPASYLAAESSRAIVSVCTSSQKDWTNTRKRLRRGLADIKQCGLKLGSANISIQRVRRENWAESWKQHFQPIEIGAALLIKPGWSRRRARAGQRVIVLDPGLSFGTGHHPTTEFCLRQLAARRDSSKAQSLLDIGTGSGILAIAAAKLGYAPVTAFDVDRDAMRVAHANARRNRVADRIHFAQADLRQTRPKRSRLHDVVCANLTSDLLINERHRIAAQLKPGGTLIVAGIQSKEFPQVRRAYRNAGLRLIVSRTENEWCSGVFG